MDAREYLNRKGVGVDREPDRPNTLEEKAWERARGAGMQRPKSGTPHDWEDWERHHDDIAEDAASLEQKIDKQAHRKLQAESASPSPKSAVGHFTPPQSPTAKPKVESTNATRRATQPSIETPAADLSAPEPVALKVAYMALAVLLPPLALGLTGAGAKRVLMSVVLTLLGWVPGVIHAFIWLMRR
ncbi:YqaE/Pmp3 family membrane protein [Vreelandella populi]|uniref:YqaE/Pmp3 family membrane protein n=1 Tax=Vreelandella populi TaxID=2498858 RepID=A0A3S0YFA8_9GAMM|nr:YqaE/Pmp3 family membrane protein [Halomonas populi]RUR40922.1 YqaE/Pmp3 family membrane protein [Halomonas populi]RUR49433.1 YqaE/Pmp3 family membrane protein [Halomonas populi]RUR55916.1 YqaE/Pmp3 family membrane protein [Halomonas populi]